LQDYLDQKFIPAELKITVEDGRVAVKRMTPGSNLDMTVDTGRTMQGTR